MPCLRCWYVPAKGKPVSLSRDLKSSDWRKRRQPDHDRDKSALSGTIVAHMEKRGFQNGPNRGALRGRPGPEPKVPALMRCPRTAPRCDPRAVRAFQDSGESSSAATKIHCSSQSTDACRTDI